MCARAGRIRSSGESGRGEEDRKPDHKGTTGLEFVAPFGPIAKASIGELVTAVSPTIDRYLTGELGEPHLDGTADSA